jgi:hypothetical protein
MSAPLAQTPGPAPPLEQARLGDLTRLAAGADAHSARFPRANLDILAQRGLIGLVAAGRPGLGVSA